VKLNLKCSFLIVILYRINIYCTLDMTKTKIVQYSEVHLLITVLHTSTNVHFFDSRTLRNVSSF
jgi:hypothetical protein